MIKEIIACLLLLLIGCVLLLSGREISLKNGKTYLTTTASLERNSNLDFKLTFDSNRLRLRRKTGFFLDFSGDSYLENSLALHKGKFCSNSSLDERAYKNSLTFPNGIGIEDLQLIFTNDPLVSDWWNWNGVLGLNPFEGCKNESDSFDSLAPLNQLRRDYSGFILDTSKLIFTNETFQGFELPLNGIFFEIEQITFGHYNFGGAKMKGKIDLETRYIKIPSRYCEEISREFEFEFEDILLSNDKNVKFTTLKEANNIQIAIKQPSQGKLLNLPLKKYWESRKTNDTFFFTTIYNVEIAFEMHNESYWSFGLQFLEDFKIHWDFKRKMIGFEPRK